MSLHREIIALLDGVTALGNRNYRDKAPEGETMPYTVLLPLVPGRAVALQAEGQNLYYRDLHQVDLWQHRLTEDPTLIDTVCAALDGEKLSAGTRVRVRATVRVPDDNQDLVHDAITISMAKPV